MEMQLLEIAERIKGLREIMGFTTAEMARFTSTTEEEYTAIEEGKSDFSFTFIYKCAEKFGVDMVEILTGEKPNLSFYTIVRKDKGLPINRRKGFKYQHLAHHFFGKMSEPFLVTAPYFEEEQDQPIHLSTHEGQEFDYILKGSLKVAMEGHIEVLHEGDSIYYNSGHGHGMIATGGEECIFLAIVLKNPQQDE